jgi:hypothetical protein
MFAPLHGEALSQSERIVIYWIREEDLDGAIAMKTVGEVPPKQVELLRLAQAHGDSHLHHAISSSAGSMLSRISKSAFDHSTHRIHPPVSR